MKRVVSLLFVAAFCFTFFACGGGKTEKPAETVVEETVVEEAPVAEDAVVEEEVVEEAPVEEVAEKVAE